MSNSPILIIAATTDDLQNTLEFRVYIDLSTDVDWDVQRLSDSGDQDCAITLIPVEAESRCSMLHSRFSGRNPEGNWFLLTNEEYSQIVRGDFFKLSLQNQIRQRDLFSD